MSRSFAEVIGEWFGELFPGVGIAITPENRLSTHGLQNWIEQLRGAGVGVLCVTRDAVELPWLHFQLGLLHRYVGRTGLVAPVFLDLVPQDVAPTPLHVFQATSLNESDCSLLVRQVAERVAPAGARDAAGGFKASWNSFRERARRVPGSTTRAFVVSVALPHRVLWFRYDPSGLDGDWSETINAILNRLAHGPFGADDIDISEYHCLDVTGETWLEPPAIVSRVGTAHLSLVHPQVVESHGGSARVVVNAIRPAVDLTTAGLKVFGSVKEGFVVGTQVR